MNAELPTYDLVGSIKRAPVLRRGFMTAFAAVATLAADDAWSRI